MINLNQLCFADFVLYQQWLKFLSLLSPTKDVREKRKFLKVKEMKVTSLLLLWKTVREKGKILKFKIIHIPLNQWYTSLINVLREYRKSCNSHPKNSSKLRTILKGKRVKYEFNKQFLQIVQNLSSVWTMMMPAKPTIFMTIWQPC